ncbi:hypothetical protein GF420_01630 [candidate division GN15 bacterium]|nr:hypothetical protein [candidate division GN15 bacterium]
MKKFLKLLFYSVGTLLGGIIGFPLGLLSLLEKWTIRTEGIYITCATMVAIIPGWPGNFVRASFYLIALEAFHPTAIIGFGSYFSNRGARVGRYAGTGAYCIMGMVDLEPEVRLASRVSITSGLHQHGSSATVGAVEEVPSLRERVRIGKGAWVGEGAIVGADIGDGAVVAVGAVVTKPVPAYSMAMGNPARILPTVNVVAPKQDNPTETKPKDSAAN